MMVGCGELIVVGVVKDSKKKVVVEYGSGGEVT